MRHSTITLTMDRYTHLFKGDEAAAVAELPELPQGRETVLATGTDGPEVRGAHHGKQWIKPPGLVDES